MRKESFELLKTLLSTPSPSGFEARIQKIWCDYARQHADEVHTDAYGNAVAVLNPGGSPKVMLDSHIDEIGLIVKHVDDKGFLYFQRIGGVDAAQLQGKRVQIHSENGPVLGVLGATAIHLQERGKERKVPKMHELFIDIGAEDKEAAEKTVAIGDPVTFVDQFDQINDNILIGRGIDNRAGAWTVIEALRQAKGKELNCAIYACANIQEETGLNGAQMQVVNVQPDVAIAVDVTHATDTPGIDNKQHGEIHLGKGPTVSIGRENHPVLVDRIRKVAKKKRIDLQTETFSLTGGTDAYAIWTKQGGIPSMILSIPNRYMHSTVEMVDLRDLQHTADLLSAFCKDLDAGEPFRVKV